MHRDSPPQIPDARWRGSSALKFLYAGLAALGLTAAGFAAGGFVAVLFWVDPVSGLTAGATVTMYAVVGAVVGLAAAMVILARTSAARWNRVGPAAVAFGVAAWGFVALWAARSRAAEKQILPLTVSLDTLPPTVPPIGTRDSLIALVAAPPEILARFETRETDYEQKALAVYGRHGAYYLVHANDGTLAWVRERDTGSAHPIEQLLMNRLNYLTSSWDLRVRDTASMAAPSRAVVIARTERAEYPAKVLEFVRRADALWINVEILSASPCEGGTPSVVTTGWIPLWGADAKPTVWFHSRGC